MRSSLPLPSSGISRILVWWIRNKTETEETKSPLFIIIIYYFFKVSNFKTWSLFIAPTIWHYQMLIIYQTSIISNYSSDNVTLRLPLFPIPGLADAYLGIIHQHQPSRQSMCYKWLWEWKYGLSALGIQSRTNLFWILCRVMIVNDYSYHSLDSIMLHDYSVTLCLSSVCPYFSGLFLFLSTIITVQNFWLCNLCSQISNFYSLALYS